ncbi:MAG TPA: MBL fold metallo-hydrolase [Solirubrobacteraceae bacterium]|nr:MBL fold metallo-hydrolase [Solirubrobacteraceae bacterium]
MRITVLGKSPSWPDAGGACSGYLVENGDTCLLLDCGSGVLAQLRRVRAYDDIDAVVVSHMHSDHFADLVPYGCALMLGPREQRPPRMPLLLPPGGWDAVLAAADAGGTGELVKGAFHSRAYDVAERERVGSLELRFQPVPHFVPTNAVAVTPAAGGGRFVFGADHRPTDALCGFADDCDLLMLEATLSEAGPEPRGHMTAGEAGEHAARVRAKRLVLTHISDELDADAALIAAQEAYDGPVELAQAGATYVV